MFKRNFDFLALTVILLGFAVIQQTPRVEQQLRTKSIAYRTALGPCGLRRALSHLAIRSE